MNINSAVIDIRLPADTTATEHGTNVIAAIRRLVGHPRPLQERHTSTPVTPTESRMDAAGMSTDLAGSTPTTSWVRALRRRSSPHKRLAGP